MRNRKGFGTVLFNRDGGRLREVSSEFLDALAGVEKIDTIVSVGLVFGADGRVACSC